MASHGFISLFICFLALLSVTSGLKCYNCQSENVLGQLNPECHNITDDKFLEDVYEGIFNTYCSVRMGNNDAGEPYTERGGVTLMDANADGTCKEDRDWNGNYTICYCKDDGCNGGSIYDFLNSTGATPEAGTTAPSNPAPTETATTGSTGGGGSNVLQCYNCQSKDIFGQLNPECHNITDDKFLEDVYEGIFNTYCSVRMGNNDAGEPYTERGSATLTYANADGTCKESRDWNGNYTICYCKSDRCNGGSIDDFVNSTGVTAHTTTATTTKTTTDSSGGGDNGGITDLSCYSCQTHPVLPEIFPPQPDCESSPKEEYLQKVPTYDQEYFKTFCAVEVVVANGEKKTSRTFVHLQRENYSSSWCEDLSSNSQRLHKICYCRTDACNNMVVDIGEGNGDGDAGDDSKGDDGEGSSGGSDDEGTPKRFKCYHCDTYSSLPSIYPPQPDCESNPKVEYLQEVTDFDLGQTKTYCSTEVVVQNGEKRTIRDARMQSRENYTASWCEDQSTETIRRKVCYCRGDACNNGVVDVGDAGGGDNGEGGSGGEVGSGGEGESGGDNGEGTGGASGPVGGCGNCSCNNKSSNWDTNLLMLHLSLVILSACFASLSVYNSFKRIRPTRENPATPPTYFAVQEKTPIRVNP